jgi:NAD(P)-dependent dehydrogenase (short-subunit alcohol dehydrogenase family)
MMGAEIALITGGASGIGLATAAALGARGYQLALLDRDAEALEKAQCQFAARDWTVRTYPADVTDGAALSAAVGDIERVGVPRILVNTAGILHLGTIADISEPAWDQLLAINLKGVFLSCKHVVPAMLRAGGGAIVNLTSQGGRTKSYYSAPDYVAAKAGVIGLTMALANQHARDGIRVNCVAPGLVETAMIDVYSPDQRERMLGSIPLGRFAKPEEVAEAIVFLATNGSSYITGQTINVNGGSFML